MSSISSVSPNTSPVFGSLPSNKNSTCVCPCAFAKSKAVSPNLSEKAQKKRIKNI